MVFLKNKSIESLRKCLTVDLLDFFENYTTENRHLDLSRHFGWFQESFFHNLFVFKDLTKRRKSFWKISIFEHFTTKRCFHSLLKYLRHLGFFSKNFNGIGLITQKSIRINIQMLQKHHSAHFEKIYTFSFRFYIGCVNNNNALTAVLADNRQETG